MGFMVIGVRRGEEPHIALTYLGLKYEDEFLLAKYGQQ
jgi:hypothetical protein